MSTRVGIARTAVRKLIALSALCVSMVGHVTTAQAAGDAAPAAKPFRPTRWVDIDGAAQTAGARATALVFISTECPISNLYIPRVAELSRQFAPKGIRFLLVDSNREDTMERLKRYRKERSLTIPILRDADLALADRVGANRTPEAIVLTPAGDIAYRGRIDDNQDRARVVRSDLRDALTAVAAGKPAPKPRTISFGCVIFRDRSAAHTTASTAVTYTRDIAPILNRNCVVCHRTGETAPFALETYRQAHTWASAIRDYTARRLMPPWKARPGYGDFHDARTLTDAEITRIAQWAAAGAPQGAAKDLPPTPKFPDPAAWSLGTPDEVVQPDRDYHLAADGADVYRNFVLPIEFDRERYITAMEFKPGNRAIVHHIVLYIDPGGRSIDLQAKSSRTDPEPGYTVPGTGVGLLDADWGEVWVPGRTPRMLPEGVAVKVPKGARLVMQVHYHKNGAPQTDRSRLALFYAKSAVRQTMLTAPLLNPRLALQPGDPKQHVAIHFKLPLDVHLHTIFPHMHLLGREMRATATLPDGKKIPLIYINDWDFNWQETYTYRAPIALPRGTTIDVDAVYDNSEANPRQSFHPARLVTWGEQTTDEMCVCVFGFTRDSQSLELNLGPGSI